MRWILKDRSFVIRILLIVLGAVTLIDARASFAPYLIACVYAIFCIMKMRQDPPAVSKRAGRFIMLASAVAALFILLASYGIWLHPTLPDVRSSLFVRLYKLILILVIFAGSYICAHSIITYVCAAKDSFSYNEAPERKRAWLFFLIPLALFLLIYLTIWYCCYYPGLMSLDTMDQIAQVFSGQYSNHQPFYHTLLIGVFVRAGLALFGTMNAAVALYVVVQILFMAITFAFTVYNLAKMRLPLSALVISTVWYAVMPFHIMFSFTVWKDVYFGAFVTLLIIFFIRLMNGMGSRIANLVGFSLCGPAICLLRSNGLFAYVFVLLAVLLLARKHKELLIIMTVTIVAAFVLKHNVLKALNVTQPDTVESLSIPLQQVARVVADDGVMSDEDIELLAQIIDVSAIKDNYDPNISDPIKNMIRDYGNQSYLSENMGLYGALYMRTLAKNPMTYVAAWVDSTCGYWNSGYNYWVWFWDVENNDFGISRQIASDGMLRFMDEYLWLYYNTGIFGLFTAIGLFVWIVMLAFAKCIATGNRTGMISIVPILAIWLSLLISSPVFAEFRYMYALFCALPILLGVSAHKRGESS